MRVGIFVIGAGRQAGGTETYERHLVRAIAQLDRDNEYHIFCTSPKAVDAFGVDQPNFRFHVLRPRVRWVSIPVSLPLSMVRQRLDISHATFVPPPFSPVKYVFTHHCFSTFARPQFYPTRIRYRLNRLIETGIRRARMILCVSENVRDLTAERFGVPTERLAVIYHGVHPRFCPRPVEEAREVVSRAFGLDEPYILYVGKLEERKNLARLLEAFRKLREEHDPDLKLVLVGRPTWKRDFLDRAIQRWQLREAVIEPGHLEQDDLPALYSAAEMFLFPSLWEGFGIPVLEAMACGTPVITSNISSLPEVAGGAALLVDPESVDEIAAAMQRLSTDTSLRKTLREKGLSRAAEFTWQRTAEQTMDAYRRVAGSES